MTGSIASGKTFSSNEEVTAAKLHQIIEAAIISNLDVNNVGSTSTLVDSDATAPTTTKLIWYDQNIGFTRLYDGTDYSPLGRGIVLTNKSGVTINRGDIVIYDVSNDSSFTRTTTADSALICGVAAESIANNVKGVIITHGFAAINFQTLSDTGGDFFATSTTAGKAKQRTSTIAGTCGILQRKPPIGIIDFTLYPCYLFGQPLV